MFVEHQFQFVTKTNVSRLYETVFQFICEESFLFFNYEKLFDSDILQLSVLLLLKIT